MDDIYIPTEEEFQFNVEDSHRQYLIENAEVNQLISQRKENLSKQIIKNNIKTEIIEEFSYGNEKASILRVIDMPISPSKYPELKKIFGDFPKFKQKAIIVNNALKNTSQGCVVDGIIGLKAGASYDIVINELSSVIIRKYFSDIYNNQRKKEKLPSEFLNEKEYMNIHLDEFLSDAVSIQASPKSEINRILRWSKLIPENKKSIQRLNDFILKKENEFERKFPFGEAGFDQDPESVDSDTFSEYKKTRKKLNIIKEKRDVMTKELQRKIQILKLNYKLSVDTLTYLKEKNPKISDDEISKKFIILGKSIVDDYKKNHNIKW